MAGARERAADDYESLTFTVSSDAFALRPGSRFLLPATRRRACRRSTVVSFTTEIIIQASEEVSLPRDPGRGRRCNHRAPRTRASVRQRRVTVRLNRLTQVAKQLG